MIRAQNSFPQMLNPGKADWSKLLDGFSCFLNQQASQNCIQNCRVNLVWTARLFRRRWPVVRQPPLWLRQLPTPVHWVPSVWLIQTLSRYTHSASCFRRNARVGRSLLTVAGMPTSLSFQK